MVILIGLILDLSIVRYMTPTEIAIPQSELISFSLPSTSLTLAITVNLIAFIRPSPVSQVTPHTIFGVGTGTLSNREPTLAIEGTGDHSRTPGVGGHTSPAEMAAS